MSAPVIDIDLDPGPWTDDQWAEYRLAEGTVSGQVRIFTESPINCRGVIVSVGWHTEGKGDKDTEAVYEETVHCGELPMGEHLFPFSARLPPGPMSYAGHHIKIIWAVHARIDVAWKIDPKAQRVFYVTLPWEDAAEHSPG